MPRFLAATLASRGVETVEDARIFLNPSLERDWLNPYELPGLGEVADAVERAVRADKHIVVFGDFDLDGISATTVLTRGLRKFGAHVTPFIPKRFEEGYALTDAAIERLCALDPAPEFVVTVDCGISCKDAVAKLVDRGIDVAITDHHEPLDLVPVGVPVADPKLDSACPSTVLAGVGVALKLVQILGGRFGRPHFWRELTDFAALGTIADLMPMLGENRALVNNGIERINVASRPCIAALLGEAGVGGKPVSSTSLSFSIIPRLNAAGRMGDAELALDMLMSDDFDEACALASRLEEMNDSRRAIEAELSELALNQAQREYHGQRALVVAGEGWHEGVKGIVASRLVGKFGVPTLLFTIDGDEARGSGRSVGQINLFKAVESTQDLLTRFGGHDAAVGVTLPVSNLEAFTQRLTAYMDTLEEDDFHPLFRIDATVDLSELTIPHVEMIDMLAPFGQENPTPMFLANNVMLSNCRAVGQGKNHFSCTLCDGRANVAGIMFHCKNIEELSHTEGVVCAAFEVQVDEWRGRRNVKAMLRSLEPARSCKALEACIEPESKDFMRGLYENGGTTSNTGNAGNTGRVVNAGDAGNGENGENGGESSNSPNPANLVTAAHPANSAHPADTAAQPDSSGQTDAGFEDTKVPSLNRDRALFAQRARWELLAQESPHELEAAILWSLIGNRPLHPSQRAVLDSLEHGESVLAVMATGRGKSLLFHVYATIQALRFGHMSIFIYPLRALIADQAYHLSNSLSRFGIVAEVLTGETPPQERRDIYARARAGRVDIVLTTPEYLQFHCDTFASFGRIGFVVVDEAHHIGQARAGHREAFAQVGEAIAHFGEPRPSVLALTATATTSAARDITSTLPITKMILDETSRENLILDDQRNCRNREEYLANLVARGEKTIIYVNSREQSVIVARTLRRRVPQLATMIGFYNAGLTRAERKRIEDLFRTGRLTVLVATSAFGEGIDIPNVRHVVLYHLPFNETEFNQMSGRAGRDGQPASVHLLFDRADALINEAILRETTPDHDMMARVYRWLRQEQRAHRGMPVRLGPDDFCRLAQREKDPVSEGAAECGIRVFRELGLIDADTVFTAGETRCVIRVHEDAGRVELTDSVRYREGLGEQDIFRAFKDWALGSPSVILQRRVCRPIVPEDHELKREEDIHGNGRPRPEWPERPERPE